MSQDETNMCEQEYSYADVFLHSHTLIHDLNTPPIVYHVDTFTLDLVKRVKKAKPFVNTLDYLYGAAYLIFPMNATVVDEEDLCYEVHVLK